MENERERVYEINVRIATESSKGNVAPSIYECQIAYSTQSQNQASRRAQ